MNGKCNFTSAITFIQCSSRYPICVCECVSACTPVRKDTHRTSWGPHKVLMRFFLRRTSCPLRMWNINISAFHISHAQWTIPTNRAIVLWHRVRKGEKRFQLARWSAESWMDDVISAPAAPGSLHTCLSSWEVEAAGWFRRGGSVLTSLSCRASLPGNVRMWMSPPCENFLFYNLI